MITLTLVMRIVTIMKKKTIQVPKGVTIIKNEDNNDDYIDSDDDKNY